MPYGQQTFFLVVARLLALHSVLYFSIPTGGTLTGADRNFCISENMAPLPAWARNWTHDYRKHSDLGAEVLPTAPPRHRRKSHVEPPVPIRSLKSSNMSVVITWMCDPLPRCCSRASLWLNGPLNGGIGLCTHQKKVVECETPSHSFMHATFPYIEATPIGKDWARKKDKSQAL